MSFIPNEHRRLVLYDLDGTLLPWDTQLLFANFVMRRHPHRRLFLIPYLMGILLYTCKAVNETFMKRLFLTYLWKMQGSRLQQLAEDFVHNELPRHYFPEMLETLRAHREHTDYCVLVTASPQFYACIIAQTLGFDDYLCTEVALDDPVSFLPKLITGNNKGQVKVDRLKKLNLLTEETPPQSYTYAYSDSRADLPMLKASEKNILVNPSENLITALGDVHPCIKTPPLPWINKKQKTLLLLKQLFGLYHNYDE